MPVYHFIVYDAYTGEPVQGAKVTVWGATRLIPGEEEIPFFGLTDANGEAYVNTFIYTGVRWRVERILYKTYEQDGEPASPQYVYLEPAVLEPQPPPEEAPPEEEVNLAAISIGAVGLMLILLSLIVK